MEDNKDNVVNPKSFRITDATAAKIKEIATEIGGSQQETMSKLIEAYEFQAGKAVLIDKKADIDKFEQYVTALTRMFMGSLEDNQHLSDTIRTEFDALLKSKDATIQDLQGQLLIAKQVRDESVAESKTLSEENAQLKERTAQLENEYSSKVSDLQSMVSDKEKMNKTLSELWADVKERLNSAQAQLEEIDGIKEELANTKEALKGEQEIRARAEDVKNKISAELKEVRDKQERREKEITEQCNKQAQDKLERALFEQERVYQQKLQKITEDKQREIDRYQLKYMELLEKISKGEALKNVQRQK